MDKTVDIKPKVTVLMPVFNAGLYLKEAIDSILCQTYRDFEFLIINDGSTDTSLEIIQSYCDDRIRLLSNETNLQLIRTLNIGIENALGEYIVRMDADDISFPDRIEKQVNFLEAHPNIAACGSWIEMFTENHSFNYKPLTDPDRIKAAFIFRTEIMHPSVTIRKSVIINNLLRFDPGFVNAEDYELFLRISFIAPLANIGEVLLKYRQNDKGITHLADKDEEKRVVIHKKIYYKALKYLGLNPDENMLNLHRFIYLDTPIETKNKLEEVYNYLILIENTNLQFQKYNDLALKKELSHQMFLVTKKAAILGLYSFLFYIKNKYFKYTEESILQHFRLIIKCLLKYRKPATTIA